MGKVQFYLICVLSYISQRSQFLQNLAHLIKWYVMLKLIRIFVKNWTRSKLSYVEILQKEVVSIGKQVQQFEMVRGNISEIMGPRETAGVLSKSLFLISVGSNDIFDYQDFNSTTLSKQDFMDTLEFSFHNHLKVCTYLIPCPFLLQQLDYGVFKKKKKSVVRNITVLL